MAVRTFIEAWSLSFSEFEFIQTYGHATRVWVALQLRHFREQGFFLMAAADVPQEALTYIAGQMGTNVPTHSSFDLASDTARRHRQDILNHLGFHRATDRERQTLQEWLCSEFGGRSISVDEMISQGYAWGMRHLIFIPSPKIMERLARAARHTFRDGFLAKIAGHLSEATAVALEASLADPQSRFGFQRLKDDAGAATLENVVEAAAKVAFLRGLDLPRELLDGIDQGWLVRLARLVEGETSSEMRRHDKVLRHGLLAVYLMDRQGKLIDGLIDLLVELVHRLGTRSRRRVIAGIAADIGAVHGKERLLVDIALASIENPEGRVADVIFPVAGAGKLQAVIDEYRTKGTLDRRIQTVMRGSYAGHYRRMLPPILSALEFRSNNTSWRPILDALSLILWLVRQCSALEL